MDSLSLAEMKTRLQTLLGREVTVEAVKNGKFAAVYIDYNLRNPSRLVAETEELAYRALLDYLESKETQTDL